MKLLKYKYLCDTYEVIGYIFTEVEWKVPKILQVFGV